MKYNLFIGSRSSNDGRRHSVPKNVSATNFINKSSMEGLIIPIGIISASSQLTASLDSRYVVCGTVEIDSYLDTFIFITSGSFTSGGGGGGGGDDSSSNGGGGDDSSSNGGGGDDSSSNTNGGY